MTDTDFRSGLTPEEAEAALASMPVHIANILRRRLGLPVPESTPSHEPMPETSARATRHEPLAGLDPLGAAERRDAWITARRGIKLAGEVNWVDAGHTSPYPQTIAFGDCRHSHWEAAAVSPTPLLEPGQRRPVI